MGTYQYFLVVQSRPGVDIAVLTDKGLHACRSAHPVLRPAASSECLSVRICETVQLEIDVEMINSFACEFLLMYSSIDICNLLTRRIVSCSPNILDEYNAGLYSVFFTLETDHLDRRREVVTVLVREMSRWSSAWRHKAWQLRAIHFISTTSHQERVQRLRGATFRY